MPGRRSDPTGARGGGGHTPEGIRSPAPDTLPRTVSLRTWAGAIAQPPGAPGLDPAPSGGYRGPWSNHRGRHSGHCPPLPPIARGLSGAIGRLHPPLV